MIVIYCQLPFYENDSWTSTRLKLYHYIIYNAVFQLTCVNSPFLSHNLTGLLFICMEPHWYMLVQQHNLYIKISSRIFHEETMEMTKFNNGKRFMLDCSSLIKVFFKFMHNILSMHFVLLTVVCTECMKNFTNNSIPT